MTTIVKTTFTFAVLHRADEPFTWDEASGDGPLDNNLGEALARSWDGHAVGMITSEETVDVPDEQVETELVALYNDGEFFDDDLNPGIDDDWDGTLLLTPPEDGED